MADLTLSDIAKTMPDDQSQGVIWTYALANHVTQKIPIENKPTGRKSWKVRNDLAYTTSATATRALGGEYTASKTPVQPFEANVKIYGGRVQYDRALEKLNPGEKEEQKYGQTVAQAHQFAKDVFEGTGGQYLWGITSQLDTIPFFSGQTIYAGTTSTPAVLTMDMLDDALSRHNVIPGQTYIYCNRQPSNRIKKLARGQGGSTAFDTQNINYSPAEFGTFAGMYDNIPVVKLVDGKGTDLLSNTDGGGTATTLYIVTYGPENFTAFQTGNPEVIDMEGVSTTVAFDLEWLVGTAAQSKRCITQIKYVKNGVA
jgi:hypothetical protein